MSERNVELSPKPSPVARRGQRFFSLLVVGLTTVSLAIVAVLTNWPAPSLGLVALFAGFMILATHREAFFVDETALSGSVVVAIAAVIAFVKMGTPLGFAVCGIVAGLHVAHLRSRAWSRLLVNASVHVIAAAVAAGSLAVLIDVIEDRTLAFSVGSVTAVTFYWLANNMILALVIGAYERQPVWPTARELVKSEAEMLVFGLCGAGCGLLIANDELMGFGLLLVLLVAVDLLVIRSVRPGASRVRAWAELKSVAGLSCVVIVGSLLATNEFPDAVHMAPLMLAAGVAGACGGRSFVERTSVALLATLVAVGAFQGPTLLAGAGLVGLTAGVGLCIRERGIARRLFAIGLGGLPVLAASAVCTALPIDASDGFGSLAGMAAAAAVTAVITRAAVVGVAILPGVGFGGVLVAMGEAVADAWLAVAGAAVVVVAWYSIAGGLALVAAVAVAAAVLASRRDARAHSAFPRQVFEEAALDVVTAALCDRPGAPTALP